MKTMGNGRTLNKNEKTLYFDLRKKKHTFVETLQETIGTAELRTTVKLKIHNNNYDFVFSLNLTCQHYNAEI